MKRFVIIILFFLGLAVAQATQKEEEMLSSFGQVDHYDSLFLYNETGEMVGKKVSGYDDAGHEIMFADYDYSNGVWIANVMKISSRVEAKEVTVGYFWEINSWVPSEMLVVEYDESHQKLSSIYQWEEDTWIPGNGQR